MHFISILLHPALASSTEWHNEKVLFYTKLGFFCVCLLQLEISGSPTRDLNISTFIFLYLMEFRNIKTGDFKMCCSVIDHQN